jgi:hypothetical protein
MPTRTARLAGLEPITTSVTMRALWDFFRLLARAYREAMASARDHVRIRW